MKRNLKITWLNACPLCKGKVHLVTTNGAGNWLHDGDPVQCTGCATKGVVFTHESNAEVIWEEEEQYEHCKNYQG